MQEKAGEGGESSRSCVPLKRTLRCRGTRDPWTRTEQRTAGQRMRARGRHKLRTATVGQGPRIRPLLVLVVRKPSPNHRPLLASRRR